MEKEVRQKIANLSNQIDSLEATIELIKTSNVLCFTTMDRSADETVSIEFTDNDSSGTNGIITGARDAMVAYLTNKISMMEKTLDFLTKPETKISKIQKKNVYLQSKTCDDQ